MYALSTRFLHVFVHAQSVQSEVYQGRVVGWVQLIKKKADLRALTLLQRDGRVWPPAGPGPPDGVDGGHPEAVDGVGPQVGDGVARLGRVGVVLLLQEAEAAVVVRRHRPPPDGGREREREGGG